MPRVLRNQTFYKFFAKILIETFSGLYNQQISPKNAKTVIAGFFVIVGISTIIITNLATIKNVEQVQKVEIKKPETQEKKVEINVKQLDVISQITNMISSSVTNMNTNARKMQL